jgi:hypothetical protein
VSFSVILKKVVTIFHTRFADPSAVFFDKSETFRIEGRSLAKDTLATPKLLEVLSCLFFGNVGVNPNGRYPRVNPLGKVLGRF